MNNQLQINKQSMKTQKKLWTKNQQKINKNQQKILCKSGLASGRSRRILLEKHSKYEVVFFEFV